MESLRLFICKNNMRKRAAYSENEGFLYEMKAVDRLFFVKYNGIKWYII